MKKLIVIGATACAALFLALSVVPSAQAYPEQSCNVTVDTQKANAGATLRVTGTTQEFTTDDGSGRASAAGTKWRAKFNGVVKTGTADVFKTSFKFPSVTTETTFLLKVKAVLSDDTTCEKTLEITAMPSGTVVSPPGDGLPNTGGPRLILLLAGLALVVAGGMAIRQSRKSDENSGTHAV